MWAYVENSVVVEIHDSLPINWRNFSNFFALESDVGYLNRLGWYEVIDDTVPIANDLEEYHGEPIYTVDVLNSVVRKTREIIKYDNPPSAESQFMLARESFMQHLRQQRDERLKETDWTQGLDIQDMSSQEWKNEWRAYRQALRDLPAAYSNPPLSSIIDSNMIDWPVAPEK